MSTNLSSKRVELAEPETVLDGKMAKADDVCNQSVVTEPASVNPEGFEQAVVEEVEPAMQSSLVDAELGEAQPVANAQAEGQLVHEVHAEAEPERTVTVDEAEEQVHADAEEAASSKKRPIEEISANEEPVAAVTESESKRLKIESPVETADEQPAVESEAQPATTEAVQKTAEPVQEIDEHHAMVEAEMRSLLDDQVEKAIAEAVPVEALPVEAVPEEAYVQTTASNDLENLYQAEVNDQPAEEQPAFEQAQQAQE